MRPPEQSKRELVQQSMDKAADDFGLAGYLLQEDSPYQEAICYHAQQAAEKQLKALLTWHDIQFPKTHDMETLLGLAEAAHPGISGSLGPSVALSAYAVELRYPDNRFEVDARTAEEAVRLASLVRERIVELLRTVIDAPDPSL